MPLCNKIICCYSLFQLTLADLAVIAAFDIPLQRNPNVMDAFPKLKEHRQRILALPNLASYVANRKDTDY